MRRSGILRNKKSIWKVRRVMQSDQSPLFGASSWHLELTHTFIGPTNVTFFCWDAHFFTNSGAEFVNRQLDLEKKPKAKFEKTGKGQIEKC